MSRTVRNRLYRDLSLPSLQDFWWERRRQSSRWMTGSYCCPAAVAAGVFACPEHLLSSFAEEVAAHGLPERVLGERLGEPDITTVATLTSHSLVAAT